MVYSSGRLRRQPQNENDLKNEDDLKNADDLKNEDDLENKDDFKIEDNLNNGQDQKSEDDLRNEDDIKGEGRGANIFLHPSLPLKNYPKFLLMTSHHDSHTTTNV